MPSLPFPDSGSRKAENLDGSGAPSRTYTVYADLDGTVLAEIYADDSGVPGTRITSAIVVTDSLGYFEIWWGPAAGTDVLYVSDGIIPPWPVYAVVDARLDRMQTAVDTAVTAATGSVRKVAGHTPDDAGNVNLIPSDIPGVAVATDEAAFLDAHNSDTTNVHGIADTSKVVLDNDSRLTNARTPLTHAGSHGVSGTDPVAVAQDQVTGLDAALDLKADLVAGVIPTAQIPALAINQTWSVTSQAEMLALPAGQGDLAIRTDTSNPTLSFLLGAADPTVLSNWVLVSFGSVVSINGQVGVVVLAAADVGAVPTSRTVTGGTGLSGGGNLVTDRTLAVIYGTTAGTSTQGNDSRVTGAAQKNQNLSDLTDKPAARTALSLGDSATRNVGSVTGTVAAGDDTRIARALQMDANLGDLASSATARTNLGLGTAAVLNTGIGPTNVVIGTDSRLTDARTPATHASTHGFGAADPITIAQSQVTSLTADLALKADLVSGKIPTSQIPAQAVTDIFPVANEAAMLGLNAQRGDLAIRSDFTPNRWFVLATDSPSTLADWKVFTAAGAVASVNGQSGVIVLAAGDVGAVPDTRTITAGTGLTGGGQLNADRTLTVAYGTTSTTAARGDDSRLSDARTPTVHATSHAPGGTDVLAELTSANMAAASVDGVAGVASMRTLGTGAQQAAAGDDSRLSDVRTPADLSVTTAKLADSAVTSAKIADATIVDGDINAAAAIAQSKVSGLVAALQAKVAHHELVYNIRDYGAVGDGIRSGAGVGTGTDDTTAINNAIVAANAAGGGTVIVPPSTGTYLYYGIVLLSNVALVGHGGTLMLKSGVYTNGSGSYYGIRANGQSNVQLRNLTIDGNGANNTIFAVGDVITVSGEDILIDGCTILNPADSGIMFTACTNSALVNNRVDNPTDVCFYVNDGSAGTVFSENVIANNRLTGGPNGAIALKRNLQRVTVANNQIYNCGWGITLEHGTGTDFSTNVTIVNNRLRHIGFIGTGTGYALELRGCDYVIATGNRLEDCKNRGVNMTSARYSVVAHNVIDMVSGSAAAGMAGIYLGDRGTPFTYSSSRNVISGNIVKGATGAGILVTGTATDTADRNIIDGNQIVSAGTYGVYIDQYTTGTQVNNNMVEGTTADVGVHASAPALVGRGNTLVTGVVSGAFTQPTGRITDQTGSVLTADAGWSIKSGASFTLGTSSSALQSAPATPLFLRGNAANVGAAVGSWLGNGADLSAAGARVVGICRDSPVVHATPLAYIDNDGSYEYASGVKLIEGSGTPEGAVTAPVGSVYHRRDGSTGTTLYVKETGSGLNTGWRVLANDALKADLASPTFTGTPAAPTATPGTNTTQLATTAFVAAADALKADLASPALTGTPIAPTAAPGTNTTQIATTAYVMATDALGMHLAGSETVTGPKFFNPGLFMDRGNVVYNATAYAGVDATGATDSAAGLQTAIDASPYGAKWFLPVGTYQWDTTVTLNRGRSLEGANFWHQRDVSPVAYGDDWSTAATTMVGTIIRSTVTSGPALLVTSNGGNNAMVGTRLSNFMLIGPGTDTSSGLAMGESNPRIVLRPIVDNVKICNFATGIDFQHVNEGKFDIAVQACTLAAKIGTDVNACTWNQLNMQRCADGWQHQDATCVANTFINPIAQNISGTGFYLQGEGHKLDTPYFEGTTAMMVFNACQLSTVASPSVQGSGTTKTFVINSGSNNNYFWGLKCATGNFTITNSGSNNLFHGFLGTAVSGSGANPWLLDTNGGALSVRNFIAPSTSGPSFQAGSSIGFRFGASGPQIINISADPEGATTAPAGSIALRSTGGGAGTTLYVKESGTGNTGWVAAGAGTGGDTTGAASAVDSEVVLFNGTTGKSLKRATGSGIAKLTSGVLSVVTAPSGTIVGTSDTQTLTAKRVTARVTSTASSATPTPNYDNDDQYQLTALAAAAAFAAPTGTPTDGQSLLIRIKDNGTARALTWNAAYRAIGVTLPTTTVISKTMYIGCRYNSADSKTDVLAVSVEA